MLNLTRLHLGIAHESQFQGLGISNCRWSAVSEVSEQGRNKLAVQLLTMTRADRPAGRVSPDRTV